MRKKQISAAVHAFHDGLIRLVPSFVAKTDQVQRHGRGQFKARIVAHPVRKLLRQFDVPANVMLQALHSVVPDHKPQLERTKSPPKRYLPLAVVNHRTRFRSLVAQIFRQDAQSPDKRLAVSNPETVAVESREHPLVWIEAVTVGELDAILQAPKLWA